MKKELSGICAFTQVAQYYYPNNSDACARRKLRNYIETHFDIKTAMEATGYQSTSNELTPKQIAILRHYLDAPKEF